MEFQKEKQKTGLSQKIYLELAAPTEEDSVSSQERIQRSLEERGIHARMSYKVLRKLYPLCEESLWKVTVSLAWDGEIWNIVGIERDNTCDRHYGYAVDYGSTTIVARLLDLETGKVLAQESVYNGQIRYGEDILTRIFWCKDNAQHREEMQKTTIESFHEVFKKLQNQTGIREEEVISAVISGNTTMIHLLLGLEAFGVFQTPYAVQTKAPGFLRAEELALQMSGCVYIVPGMENYLGGDILSGMIATGFYKEEGVSLFFDIGTNGELVVGGRDFLLCGAGAAGPALEGGSVKTGMRAIPGVVEKVWITGNGEFSLGLVGEDQKAPPLGICGSGIVDMIAQLFLNGWINFKGEFQPEKSEKIQKKETGDDREEYAVEYAEGLFFYQSDIEEFLKTKAAAATMMEYMLNATGIGLNEIRKFYMAGAFGTHVEKESAITIGMYPDVSRDQIVPCGNSSLEGAGKILLDKSLLMELDQILSLMSYVQFGAVDDFLMIMQAASVIPHMDMERYPSVRQKLQNYHSKTV